MSVPLVADLLVTVVLPGKLAEEWLNDTTPQVKHQGQGGLFPKSVV